MASAKPFKSGMLELGEVTGFTLVQVAGLSSDFEEQLTSATGKLPEKIGTAILSRGRTVMRVGPSQFWFIGGESDKLASKLQESCAVTPLSHGRCRIYLEGKAARDVLAKGIPLDFHENAFTPGMFAMTGLHHTPVLAHCVSADRFEIYALRTFALNVWDWLTDAALEFTGDPESI